MKDTIDLGDDHVIVLTDYKGEKRVGGNVAHLTKDGCVCNQFIPFEGRAWANGFQGRITTWKVENDLPLTLSPSLLCRACGDHGFIRNGKWERA